MRPPGTGDRTPLTRKAAGPSVAAVLDLLLPRCCVRCGRRARGLCEACVSALPPAPQLAPPPGMRNCWALVEHRGAGRDLVVALKYRRHLDAVELLGSAMAQLVQGTVGLVTWAPTTRSRRRERGFDQAEVLARGVARSLGVGCVRLLERRSGANQTGRSRDERLCGPAFSVPRPAYKHLSPDRPVLIVDDVRTTGATLCAASEALIQAGVSQIDGLTLSVRP